ncbi:hypothetical protein [Salipiger mucosus]|uniref:Uncharacterized protein n=1 Tax=Salipiger mucosus DSM 16094 TaxID=1123237 RepID=S9Q809_9RHOB|nr:hypothetical protein [Salipiger mucosus]EPX76122.1 hypothetical protein Salmuc_00775 [Salipiger mucosus DSM 16094]
MHRTLTFLAALALAGAAGAASPQDSTTEGPYDLLFRQGTLDDVAQDRTLVYTREVTNAADPEAAAGETGLVALSFSEGERDTMANLQFRQEGKHRNLGSFPASVGNPMIMVFYETVIRDMAEATGGSAFYIRNRVKEALVEPAEISQGEARFEGGEVPVTRVVMHPFADDAERARMGPFADLELSVVMSDEVPGWYLSLTANAPDASGGDGGYVTDMRFDTLEPAR